MSFWKLFQVSALALAMGTGSAMARQATDAELKSLDEAVAAYKLATQKNDTHAIIDSVPAKIFKVLAKKSNMDEKQVREGTIKQIDAMAPQLKFIDWNMDLANKVAGELESGEPYFVAPITAVVEANGQKQKVQAKMVVVLDEGKWSFITANSALHTEIMKEAFPGLEKADLGAPQAEPVK